MHKCTVALVPCCNCAGFGFLNKCNFAPSHLCSPALLQLCTNPSAELPQSSAAYGRLSPMLSSTRNERMGGTCCDALTPTGQSGQRPIMYQTMLKLPLQPRWLQKANDAQGQDISCNGRGRQGEGTCSIAEISLCGLFYFGSVPKADDLNGSLSLVDAIVKQVISVD